MNLKKPYSSYKWQFQPYVSWKGKSTTSIISIKSRPNTNQTSRAAHSAPNNPIYVDEANDYSSAFGTARPLKHYRKQLKPPRKDSAKTVGRDQSMIDLPGSTVYLGTNSNDCSKCKDEDNSILGSIKENILRENNDIKEHIHEGDKFLNSCNGRPVCQSCNAPNNRIRSAVTLLDKKYYSDTRNYLKSRVKTYEQNLNLSKNKFIQYQDEEGNPIYPTNNFYSWQGLLNDKYGLDGDKAIAPQQFVSTNLIQKGCNDECNHGYTKKTIIYKPSNQNFAQQGAVSSGLRTLNAKVNNINKNANSFYTAWGREGANAGKYSSNVNPPIFLKSRYQVCIPNIRRRVIWNNNTGRQPKGGSGNHTLCFHTPQGSIIPSTNGDTISNVSGAGTGTLIPKQQIFR
jgi:hypothetical protein